MAVKEILLLGNPLLRKKCEKVRAFGDSVLSDNLNDLEDTLADFRLRYGFGRGIAAPQIGVTRRIIFVRIDKPIVLVNPQIKKRSKEKMILWDDCFSFRDILVKVERHVKISVDYQDGLGNPQRLEAVGGLAELLQHELDHLDGILAVDRAIDSRHIILRSEWEKMHEVTDQVLKL